MYQYIFFNSNSLINLWVFINKQLEIKNTLILYLIFFFIQTYKNLRKLSKMQVGTLKNYTIE